MSSDTVRALVGAYGMARWRTGAAIDHDQHEVADDDADTALSALLAHIAGVEGEVERLGRVCSSASARAFASDVERDTAIARAEKAEGELGDALAEAADYKDDRDLLCINGGGCGAGSCDDCEFATPQRDADLDTAIARADTAERKLADAVGLLRDAVYTIETSWPEGDEDQALAFPTLDAAHAFLATHDKEAKL